MGAGGFERHEKHVEKKSRLMYQDGQEGFDVVDAKCL